MAILTRGSVSTRAFSVTGMDDKPIGLGITFGVAVNALARIRALEMSLFAVVEHLTGRKIEESMALHQEELKTVRERLLKGLGYENIAFDLMLRELGVDLSPEDIS